jgi:hypothetical protein
MEAAIAIVLMLVMQDDSLWTPLLIAASAGHKEIAKMLIGNV